MNFIKQAASLVCVLGVSLTTMAELVVEDGYVRKPMPGRSMTAAFMEIHNTSTKDAVLTHASLEGAGSVEIHTHSHVDGVMRMRQLFELPIKAGESVTLEPGGLHLMIFAITKLPEKPKLELCTADKICYTTMIETKSLLKKN